MIIDRLNTKELSNYENLALSIIENACLKLTAAVDLLKYRYAHPSAFFLAVVAEEELAKLIMLPIAKELDELENLVDEKNRKVSIYYNHVVKQKIFTSYGLQNRDHKSLQKLKERCLYVGVDNRFNPQTVNVSIKKTFDEIVLACMLFTDFTHKFIRGSKFIPEKSETVGIFSEKFKEIAHSMIIVLRESIDHKLPQLRKRIHKKLKEKEITSKANLKRAKLAKADILPIALSDPFILIDLFKDLYGKENYKSHLRSIMDKNYGGMKEYIIKTHKDIWGGED